MRLSALVVVLCCVLAACTTEDESPQIPPRQAPAFTGTDQSGKPFSSEQLKGKPWIASFFFTTCQSVCPALNAEQKKLVDHYGGKVGFVSISTDPTVDTGQTLSAYATEYGAVSGTWWMITMPEQPMREIATKGFLLMDPKEPAMHSTRFVAVDGEGTIRGYFDSSSNADVQKLKTWIDSQL